MHAEPAFPGAGAGKCTHGEAEGAWLGGPLDAVVPPPPDGAAINGLDLQRDHEGMLMKGCTAQSGRHCAASASQPGQQACGHGHSCICFFHGIHAWPDTRLESWVIPHATFAFAAVKQLQAHRHASFERGLCHLSGVLEPNLRQGGCPIGAFCDSTACRRPACWHALPVWCLEPRPSFPCRRPAPSALAETLPLSAASSQCSCPLSSLPACVQAQRLQVALFWPTCFS